MYRISWNEFERLAVDLFKKIKESNQKYDHIICVARGGLLLGRLLSELLDVPLGVVSARHYDNQYVVRKEISCFHKINGNVLLVDDILEETISCISENIKQNNKNIKNIDFAGIFYRPKENKKFIPKYYINKIQDALWVCFPYQTKSLKKHADI
jgi:uncharacterized protein